MAAEVTTTETQVQEWPDSIRSMITWLEQTSLPHQFYLHPGAFVQNGRLYRHQMLEWMEEGPSGQYAQAAAHNLKRLHELFGNTAVKR